MKQTETLEFGVNDLPSRNSKLEKQPIAWATNLFLLLTPIFGIGGLVYLSSSHQLVWQSWVLFGFYFVATGISITGGYHRLFSHKSYEASAPVKIFFLFFGGAAFQQSVLEWCEGHRIHHKFVDTPDDPYSIKKGFFYAHLGWLFRKKEYTQFNVKDLEVDPLVKFQHDHYHKLAIFGCFFLPGFISMTWGSFWDGVLISGALRVFLVHHVTFFINSLCHTFGERTYSKEQTARDSWWIAILTFGEGYHNFHHEFQTDYRNGIRWFDFDPTKWLIYALSKLGLASNLKVVKQETILRKTLFLSQKEAISKFIQEQKNVHPEWEAMLEDLRNKAVEIQKQIYDLRIQKSALAKAILKSKREELEQVLKTWDLVLNKPQFV